MTFKPPAFHLPAPASGALSVAFFAVCTHGCGKVKFDLDRDADDQGVEGDVDYCRVCGTLTITPYGPLGPVHGGRDTD